MKTRKIAAILLAVVMITASIVADAAREKSAAEVESQGGFVPRLTAPSKSNSYYYSDKNPLYEAGYGMPNCTAYAWGRAAEITGEMPALCLANADNWWQYNMENGCYPYGQTPKVGAVACWNYTTGGGHVAVVEAVDDSGVTYSNSAYGGENFYLTHADAGELNGGVDDSTWVFKGYIYVTEESDFSQEADAAQNDVYVIKSGIGVNFRNGPGTSYKKLSAIPCDKRISVTETKENGGYIWGRINYYGKDGWCVLDYAEKISK